MVNNTPNTPTLLLPESNINSNENEKSNQYLHKRIYIKVVENNE